MIAIITALILSSFAPFYTTAESDIDYIQIIFQDTGWVIPGDNISVIPDYNISTNFTFTATAGAFSHTYGFVRYVTADWSIINNGSNATVEETSPGLIKFFSGWKNGTAILKAEWNGYNDTVVLTINSSLVSYYLQPIWNFIGIPYGLELNASSLFEKISGCTMILLWNASLQDFYIYLPGTPDFDVSGRVILVGVTNYSIISFPANSSIFPYVSLYPGWNFLIWLREKPITAEEIYENITGCTIVLKWNASIQDFDLYVPGSPNNFVIRKGEGFLVAVTEESVWYA